MTHDLARRALIGLVAGAAASGVSRAAGLPSPSEKVILTVSGKISGCNGDNAARFDLPMLEALGMQGFATATPWYRGVTRFDGVLIRNVLRTVKASGQTMTAVALNDYTTEIPISDCEQFDVLLAFKRDGEYMPIRDKGPLFIVYPFDSDIRLKNQRYFGRSAWQLNQLIVS